MTTPVRAGRTRNAAASREALLASARTLFSERGFDNTTVRDIGEEAGVDPALIARYFGSKVNLYLATVTAEDADSGRPEDLQHPAQLVEWLVSRVELRGPGPVLQALVRSDSTPEIREAARGHLTRRLVDPLTAMLDARRVPDARVRAEVVVSALIGVLLARKLGSFESLATLTRRELVDLLTAMLPDLS
ncbi:MAG TPA: TetR family transcriptional regulator [Frankiaceae bacterium]|jgi:AcrR family transcriptional regulator|nr:TetR family transcriptional regulator [Frankiaceae bacterium]